MRAFWPGPMTLILRRAGRVSDAVTGGQDTVGLRVPSHPVAAALLKAFGSGIAAPSANRFGHVSATTAQHVKDEFGDRVDLVIDGGPCEVGIESTIIDATLMPPALVRPGKISVQAIESTTGVSISVPERYAGRAPGTLASHYAPDTPIAIVATAALVEFIAQCRRGGKRCAVLARESSRTGDAAAWIVAPRDAAGYAHDLYANLRTLDQSHCDVLIIEQLPADSAWTAVNDRISRAAGDGK
jgi:L-threonylcarbamoyladenylate synthase